MQLSAMVLSAGLGTRLRPLTYVRPKPLIPVVNRPILYRVLDLISAAQIKKVVINLHHMSEYLLNFLKKYPHGDVIPSISIEKQILGTGGGIKKAEKHLSDRFVVINGDTIADVDLNMAVEFHISRKATATMVLIESDYAPRVRVDDEFRVSAIERQDQYGLFTYTGIQVIEKQILEYLEPDRFADIVDVYRRLIKEGHNSIYGYPAQMRYWYDLGKIDDYIRCNRELLKDTKLHVGSSTSIYEDVTIEDWAIIGNNCIINEGVLLKRSILWDNVVVEKGARVIDSIVSDNKHIAGNLIGEIL